MHAQSKANGPTCCAVDVHCALLANHVVLPSLRERRRDRLGEMVLGGKGEAG